MKIEYIDNPNKLVIMWLNNSEAADAEMQKNLVSMFNECKEKGYMPFTIESGFGNLETSMHMLIERNFKTIENGFTEEKSCNHRM